MNAIKKRMTIFMLTFMMATTTVAMPATAVDVQAKTTKVCIAASGKGKCYHKSSKCSRMRGRVKKLTLKRAKQLKYRACKKCYKR